MEGICRSQEGVSRFVKPGVMARFGIAAALVAFTMGCNEPASPRPQQTTRPSAAEPCSAEPQAPFDCAVEGAPSDPSLHVTGQVTAIEAPDDMGRRHIAVSERTGTVYRLAVQPSDLELPLETGHTYDFELDRVGGMPPASGLIVRDADGIVFAGASDQGIGMHVLTGGVPGVGLELLAPTCPSRGAGECYDAVFNRALKLTLGGETVELHQGESVQLGGYVVHCRIAQQVKYSARCADFAMHAVSYTIARTAIVK